MTRNTIQNTFEVLQQLKWTNQSTRKQDSGKKKKAKTLQSFTMTEMEKLTNLTAKVGGKVTGAQKHR